MKDGFCILILVSIMYTHSCSHSVQAGCAAVVPVQLASMPDGTPLPALWQMDAPLEVPQVQAFDYSVGLGGGGSLSFVVSILLIIS